MDKQSLFFTTIVGITSILLLLSLLNLLGFKLKLNREIDNKLNPSYSIWWSSIVLTFSMFLKVALELVENAIEIIISDKLIDNTFIAVIEKIAIYIGFTFIFTFIAYLIVHRIFNLSFGQRNDSVEMDNNNIGYFITKGITLIVLVYPLITIFEHLLKWFSPIINTPFYH